MRKALLVVSAIGVLTLGIAGMSSASESQWTAMFQAGTDIQGTTALKSIGLAYAATTATSLDGTGVQDSKDGKTFAAALSPVAVAAWYRENWTDPSVSNPSKLWRYDYQKSMVAGEVKTWTDLVVYATPGYEAYTGGDKIKLFISSSTSNVMPNSIGGHPVVYKMVMTYHPEGYTGQTEWILPSVPAAGGLIATIELPSAGAVTSNPFAATQVAGYRFNFVTPEPGSLLVLASGLTGLLGLARRRSA